MNISKIDSNKNNNYNIYKTYNNTDIPVYFRGNLQPTKKIDTTRPRFWRMVDKFVVNKVIKNKRSPFSPDKKIRQIEIQLNNLGVNVRFKSLDDANGVLKGIKILNKKGVTLPKNILFLPKHFDKLGVYGLTYTFNVNKKESPIFLARNFTKLKNTNGNTNNRSTENPLHTLFHETGHWLQHQNPNFNESENVRIWTKEADIKHIENVVSPIATRTIHGGEFIAEVFAGLVDGKKYDSQIIDLANKLKATLL